MPIVPKKITEKVSWYQQRVTPWTSNSAAIGILPAEATAMGTKVTAAADALTAHQDAQNAARAATTTLYDALRDMGDYGSTLINKIKAKAGQDGDGVYALALIPPPATPAPVPAPGTPFQPKVELFPDGSLNLFWKCNNPAGSQGTMYNVFRQLGGTGEFVFIGGVGQKDFIDSTIPKGTSMLVYKVQAVRSSAIGVAAEFTIKFGSVSGGTMTASVEVTTPTGPKIAA